MPLSAGAVFGYFGVCLGVSTISGEPVDILPWNCVQVRLVLLWQLLHRKKVFQLIVLSDGSHLGVFLSPFWSKILKCSQEIEEYSYAPHFFWEPLNIFPWNFVQVFLVLLSLHYFAFFISSWRRSFSAAGHFGVFWGNFFMKFYTDVLGITLVLQHLNVFSHDLAPSFCLGSFGGISSISWEPFIISSRNFMLMFLVLLWQLLNLNDFSHHVPLCWGPFGGDILGSFWVCFSMYWESLNIFDDILCRSSI